MAKKVAKKKEEVRQFETAGDRILRRRCEAVGIEWRDDDMTVVYDLHDFLAEKLGFSEEKKNGHPIHAGVCPSAGTEDADMAVCGINIDDLLDIARRAGWLAAYGGTAMTVQFTPREVDFVYDFVLDQVHRGNHNAVAEAILAKLNLLMEKAEGETEVRS